jgi:hypothetical protein
MSRWVVDDNDLMDCDYEVEGTEMGSKRQAPPRWLLELSPPRSEEDDSIEDKEEGSTN